MTGTAPPDGAFDDALLDDPVRLAATDAAGLLRAAATAGAQVRSTAAAAQEAGLGRLAGERPRALVVVAGPGAPSAAGLLVALLGPACPVPVVVAASVPVWVGALDVVLVGAAGRAGDRELAEGVDRAVRRGAQVVLVAPEDGPVAAAAAGRAVLVEPRVEVPPALALPRSLAAGLVVLDELGLLRAGLDVLADELDREAERAAPAAEAFVNPAKSLAQRLAGRTPLLWGTGPVAAAVAALAARSLAAHAGVVAHAASLPDGLALPALRRAANRAGGAEALFRDPFDDPFDDPGPPPVRAVLLGVAGDRAGPPGLAADALPDADEVTADEELLLAPGDPARTVCAAAVLALRFELAALYLGLASAGAAG